MKALEKAAREEIAVVVEACGRLSSLEVNEKLDAVLLQVKRLDEGLEVHGSVLVAYHLQAVRKASRSLHAEVARVREELAPRKAFSFRKEKPKAAPARASAAPDELPPAAAVEVVPSVGEVFEGLRGAVVARSDVSGDVTLRSLDGCRVLLRGVIGALHCHQLRDCEVVVGAIAGSALMYGCTRCVFTLAAKQLRLHESQHVSLHLHTLSLPVIEHCRRIAVGPFDTSYPDLADHWRQAALGSPLAGTGLWEKVQDFNWHKRQASPNWLVVPPELRREPVELDDAAGLDTVLCDLDRYERCWEEAESQGEAAAHSR